MKNIFSVNRLKNLQILTITVYIIVVLSPLFTHFSWSLFLFTIGMYFLIFGFGVSLTFHRSITHRAVKMNPLLEVLGKFFASMGGTGSPISWVLVHRAHHVYSDTELDPHSARDVLKYIIGKYPKVSTRGIRRLSQSRVNRLLHKHYYLIIFAYASMWAWFGADLFLWGFVYPMALNMISGHLVNWYTHSDYPFNYRLHNTHDTSQNNIVIGLVTWGEGYHNTHHKYPARANFSMRWWEFDATYVLILILEKIKLVSKKT